MCWSQRGEDAALQVAAVMHQGQVVPLDADIALNAAKIGSEWKLPLADSVILATARAHGALVWTQDVQYRRQIEPTGILKEIKKKAMSFRNGS